LRKSKAGVCFYSNKILAGLATEPMRRHWREL